MKPRRYLLLILTLYFKMYGHSYQPSTGSEFVHKLIAITAKEGKNVYGLHPCGSGISMPDGPIRKFILSFNSRSSLSKEPIKSTFNKVGKKHRIRGKQKR